MITVFILMIGKDEVDSRLAAGIQLFYGRLLLLRFPFD